MKKSRRSRREQLDKEVEIQLQLKEQEEKKKLEEAARKRLEEIELERQRQEALLKHYEMVLENKRKEKQTGEQRNESMVRERSKLIHDMQKISEAHDGLLVKCRGMKHDLDVTNSAKARLDRVDG